MEKEINEIIIELSKLSMYDEKNIILDSLDILISELDKIELKLNTKMHQLLDERKQDELNQVFEIQNKIHSLQNDLKKFNVFRPDKMNFEEIEIYETKKTLANKEECKLNEDLSFTKPYKIRIQDTFYELPKNTWTDALEVVCDIFAGKDKNKFIEFTKYINSKKIDSIKFLDCNPNNDKKIYHIKHADVYLKRSGDSKLMSLTILELLKYFHCDKNYGIYINNRKQKKEINNDKNIIRLNSKIDHITYGEGYVDAIDDKYVYIQFNENIGRKQFPLSSINAEKFKSI